MGTLDGKRIAFLATDGVEQVELTEPLKAVRDAGAEVDLISLKNGEFQGFNHLDKGDTFTADKAVGRRRRRRLRRARAARAASPTPTTCASTPTPWPSSAPSSRPGKPVGVICHGPWTLVEADVVRGRTLTSWPTLQTDLRNAGARLGRRGGRRRPAAS